MTPVLVSIGNHRSSYHLISAFRFTQNDRSLFSYFRDFEQRRFNDEQIKITSRTQKPVAPENLKINFLISSHFPRDNRVAIDLVHDDVEIQLLKEVEVIRGVQALLKKTLDESTEQIRLLRSANYHLNKDTTDKLAALRIDGQQIILALYFQVNSFRCFLEYLFSKYRNHCPVYDPEKETRKQTLFSTQYQTSILKTLHFLFMYRSLFGDN